MIVQDVPAEVRSDPTAVYEAAIADRRAGRNAQAVERLGQVLLARPDDTDARLQRGLALLAIGRLDDAEADFHTVLDVAPDYADARLGLAQVARRRGDLVTARLETERAAALAPGRPDIEALRLALRDAPSMRIDLDVSRSRLGAGLADWSEGRLGVARSLTPTATLSAALEWTDRFGNQDVFVEARLDRRFTWGAGHIAFGGAPDADYRPEAMVRTGVDMSLTPGLSGTIEASAARFASGTVTSLTPGLSAEILDARVRVAARWINVWDEFDQHRSGYAVSAVWAATDRMRLRLNHADAPETSEGVTVDVQTIALSGEFDLNQAVSLRIGALYEDRGAYDRKALTFGIGWRFW